MAYGAFFCLTDFGETNQFKAFHWINVSVVANHKKQRFVNIKLTVCHNQFE